MKIEPVTEKTNIGRTPVQAETLTRMGVKVSMTRGSGLRADMMIDGRKAKVAATSGRLDAPVIATFEDGS